MNQKFKYYLHDNNDKDELVENIRRQGVKMSDTMYKNLGRPFYEIGLNCEIDENGNVEILGIIKE